MDKNIVDHMLSCIDDYFLKDEYVSTMDFLKHTRTPQQMQDILKQIKKFAPRVDPKDILVVGQVDGGLDNPVIGAIFTKDTMYTLKSKPIPLYGIQDVQIEHKTKGTFKKTDYESVVVIYEDKTIKFELEGYRANKSVSLLNHIYPCASSGKTSLSFLDIKKQAMNDLINRDGMHFEKLLKPLAKENGEAAVMLMNYYYDMNLMQDYYEYRKIALEHKAPQAYYRDAVSKMAVEKYEEAYLSFIKAFEYGITGHEPTILELQKRLRNSYHNVLTKPYHYNDLDIDPFMIDYIYPDDITSSYVEYLKMNNISQNLINEWKQCNEEYLLHNFYAPSYEDKHFFIVLGREMHKHKSVYVHKYTKDNYDQKLLDEIEAYVWKMDCEIKDYCNGFDHFTITKLPRINFSNAEFKEMRIESLLDMKTYVNRHQTNSYQFDIYDHPTAYDIIHQLKNYDFFKKNRLSSNKTESVRYLEAKISAYEACMQVHKRVVNRMLALTYLWSNSSETNKASFNFNDYFKKAKEQILKCDKAFLEVRNAYLKQLNMSEFDLFKNRSYEEERRLERFKHRVSQLIDRDKLQDVDFFEYPFIKIYAHQEDIDNRLDSFIKHVCPQVKKDDILLYEQISSASSTGYIFTKDKVYSTYLERPISLNGLICIKFNAYKRIVAVYENRIEEISSTEDIKRDLEEMIYFINSMLIYL